MVREYRPMLFFSLLSLLFLLLSAILFVPILSGYLHTGWVDRIPTLLVSGISLVIAVLSFFSGLILDVVANKYRQLFQLALIAAQDRCAQRLAEAGNARNKA